MSCSHEFWESSLTKYHALHNKCPDVVQKFWLFCHRICVVFDVGCDGTVLVLDVAVGVTVLP